MDMQQLRLNDQDMLKDALKDEKWQTTFYNWCAYETSNPQIKQLFLDLLKQEHEHAEDFHNQLQNFQLGNNMGAQATQPQINKSNPSTV